MYSNMSTAEREKLGNRSPYSGFKIPRAARPYVVFVSCALVVLLFMHSSKTDGFNDQQYKYGIMFDAGSTGSRIHVYKFLVTSGGLDLKDELFRQVKPGLSSYPDDVAGAKASIQGLLDEALTYIPQNQHSETQVALKASAGLRILGEEKSIPILNGVGDLLNNSAFTTNPLWNPEIMGGDKEAVYAWVTLNYLSKAIGHGDITSTFGTLDLGGGSTQIAFAPKLSSTVESAPSGYMTSEKVFGHDFNVYIHSYLNLGLMSFRQQILGGAHENTEQTITTPCFKTNQQLSWSNARSDYKIIGSGPNFDSCYSIAKNVLTSHNIHKPAEIKTLSWYAFSYYFDRAQESGLISDAGGEIKVGQFLTAAKNACSDNAKFSHENADWMCTDLTVISALLIDGFGFGEETELKLYKKIDGIETQWSLGATFALFAK